MALKITLDSGQTVMVGDVAVKNTSKPNKKNGGHGGKAYLEISGNPNIKVNRIPLEKNS